MPSASLTGRVVSLHLGSTEHRSDLWSFSLTAHIHTHTRAIHQQTDLHHVNNTTSSINASDSPHFHVQLCWLTANQTSWNHRDQQPPVSDIHQQTPAAHATPTNSTSNTDNYRAASDHHKVNIGRVFTDDIVTDCRAKAAEGSLHHVSIE